MSVIPPDAFESRQSHDGEMLTNKPNLEELELSSYYLQHDWCLHPMKTDSNPIITVATYTAPDVGHIPSPDSDHILPQRSCSLNVLC